MSSEPGLIIPDPNPDPDTLSSNHFGFSVSCGDFNGDNYSDVLIGSEWDGGGFDIGRAYIYYGGGEMDSLPDIILDDYGAIYFGNSVANLGDVNGDGYEDFGVGAPGWNNGFGRVYIYFGGPGIDSIPDVILAGELPNSSFGSSIDGGDFNGDGYSDVLVGSKYYGTGFSRMGKVYIFFGGVNMDTVPDWEITGEPGDFLGYQVESFKKLTNLGWDDFGVNKMKYLSYTDDSLFIYYGSDSLDNWVDLILTGSLDSQFGNPIQRINMRENEFSSIGVGAIYDSIGGKMYLFIGGEVMDTFPDGYISGGANITLLGGRVGGAGDVDGDGMEEVLVGNWPGTPTKIWLLKYTGSGIRESGFSCPSSIGFRVYPVVVDRVLNIHFEFSGDSYVEIRVYDATGRLVRKLVDGRYRRLNCIWDLRDGKGNRVRSGVYFVRMDVDVGVSRVGRVLVVR